MMKNIIRTLSVFLPFCLMACNEDTGMTDRNLIRVSAVDMGAPQAILPKLHALNLAEIDAGELAAEKGCSAGVKAYGQKLADDHKDADEDVMELAQEHSVDLDNAEWSDEDQDKLDAHDAAMNELEGMTDCSFDDEFAKVMVDAHEFAISVVESALDDPNNSELDEFLTETLAELELHLAAAEELVGEEPPGEEPPGEDPGEDPGQNPDQTPDQEGPKTQEEPKDDDKNNGGAQEQDDGEAQGQDDGGDTAGENGDTGGETGGEGPTEDPGPAGEPTLP